MRIPLLLTTLMNLTWTLSVSAAPVALSNVTVSDSDNPTGVEQTVSLAAGADLLRVTGDWSVVSGSAKSNELSLTITGPDGQTGFIRDFTNALNTGASVTDLTGDAVLTSTGTAGLYTFAFNTAGSSTTASLTNVSVELEKILESFTNSASLNSGDPTFNRPNENFTSSGLTCRYEVYHFTPTFSGTYTIDSEQTYDGFIFLYSGTQTTAPFTSGIDANDDSSSGLSYSRLDVTLTAGQPYTLVTSSFDPGISGSFTNTIRFSAPLDNLPDFAPSIAFTGQTLSFDVGDAVTIDAGVDGNPTPTYQWYREENGELVALDGETGATLSIGSASALDSGDYYLEATNSEGTVNELVATVIITDPINITYETYVTTYSIVGNPEDDDNGNGIPNLVEYAIRRVPTDPDIPPYAFRIESDQLICRFYRDSSLSDIDYIVEVNDILTGTWTTLYNSSVDTSANSDGAFHEVQDTTTISTAGRRFIRLKIEKTTP